MAGSWEAVKITKVKKIIQKAVQKYKKSKINQLIKRRRWKLGEIMK
jgi:hypothetical protein